MLEVERAMTSTDQPPPMTGGRSPLLGGLSPLKRPKGTFMSMGKSPETEQTFVPYTYKMRSKRPPPEPLVSRIKQWENNVSEPTLKSMDDDVARAIRQMAQIARGEEPEDSPLVALAKKNKWGKFKDYGKALGKELATIAHGEQEKWDEVIDEAKKQEALNASRLRKARQKIEGRLVMEAQDADREIEQVKRSMEAAEKAARDLARNQARERAAQEIREAAMARAAQRRAQQALMRDKIEKVLFAKAQDEDAALELAIHAAAVEKAVALTRDDLLDTMVDGDVRLLVADALAKFVVPEREEVHSESEPEPEPEPEPINTWVMPEPEEDSEPEEELARLTPSKEEEVVEEVEEVEEVEVEEDLPGEPDPVTGKPMRMPPRLRKKDSVKLNTFEKRKPQKLKLPPMKMPDIEDIPELPPHAFHGAQRYLAATMQGGPPLYLFVCSLQELAIVLRFASISLERWTGEQLRMLYAELYSQDGLLYSRRAPLLQRQLPLNDAKDSPVEMHSVCPNLLLKRRLLTVQILSSNGEHELVVCKRDGGRRRLTCRLKEKSSPTLKATELVTRELCTPESWIKEVNWHSICEFEHTSYPGLECERIHYIVRLCVADLPPPPNRFFSTCVAHSGRDADSISTLAAGPQSSSGPPPSPEPMLTGNGATATDKPSEEPHAAKPAATTPVPPPVQSNAPHFPGRVPATEDLQPLERVSRSAMPGAFTGLQSRGGISTEYTSPPKTAIGTERVGNVSFLRATVSFTVTPSRSIPSPPPASPRARHQPAAPSVTAVATPSRSKSPRRREWCWLRAVDLVSELEGKVTMEAGRALGRSSSVPGLQRRKLQPLALSRQLVTSPCADLLVVPADEPKRDTAPPLARSWKAAAGGPDEPPKKLSPVRRPTPPPKRLLAW